LKMKLRKSLTVLSALSVLLTSSITYGSSGEAKNSKEEQLAAIAKITANSLGKERINWNKDKGIPSFVVGKLSNKKVYDTRGALAALEDNKHLFHLLSANDELALLTESKDDLNISMFKFQQVYKGVPVFGQQLIVHADAKGEVTSINGYFDPQVRGKGIDIHAKLSASEAIQAAKNDTGLSDVKHFDKEEAQLYLYEAPDKNHYLVYQVELSTLDNFGEPAYWEVFVDAHDGAVVDKIDNLKHSSAVGTGTGVLGDTRTLHTFYNEQEYYLRDTTKPMTAKGGHIETYTAAGSTDMLPGFKLWDEDNVWTNPAAVDAHYHTGLAYDYFYTKFNRDSYDGNGHNIISTVNYGYQYNNAFWNGSYLVYGDGDGSKYLAFSGALDVVGHEFTHAVADHSANFIYRQQSGALEESFADVFGELIQNKPDNHWLHAEDIYTPGIAGDAARSLANPRKYGQPEHMRDYIYMYGDNGGVHYNSGIPNKAFYNFVTSPEITRDIAAQVWYRALTQYLTTYSEFADAREATIQSAIDLYGAESNVVTAVTNAWDQVGVYTVPPIEPDVYEPNESQAAAFGPISSDIQYTGNLYDAADSDWFTFSTTSGGEISLTFPQNTYDYYFELKDENGTTLVHNFGELRYKNTIEYLAPAPGTFYIQVSDYNSSKPFPYVYSFIAKFPDTTNTDIYEPNNSFQAAYGPIQSGVEYQGKISKETDEDYFKFTTAESGNIMITLTDLPEEYDLQLYDMNHRIIGAGYASGTYPETVTVGTYSPGTYYVRVFPREGYDGINPYTLRVTYPDTITEGQWFERTVTSETVHPFTQHYYKTFTVPNAKKIAVHFKRFELTNYETVYIYDKVYTQLGFHYGPKSEFWAAVDGDTITVQGNISPWGDPPGWGFMIDKIAYFSDQPMEP